MKNNNRGRKRHRDKQAAGHLVATDLPVDVQEAVLKIARIVKKAVRENPAAHQALSQTGNHAVGHIDDYVPAFMKAYLDGGYDEFLPVIQLDGMKCDLFVVNISDRPQRIRTGRLAIGGGSTLEMIIPDADGTLPAARPSVLFQLEGKYQRLEPAEAVRFSLDADDVEIDKLKEQFLYVEVNLEVNGEALECVPLILSVSGSGS